VTKRIAAVLVVALGFVGCVGCIGTIVTAWIVSARLNRMTESGFVAIDDTLALAQRRLVDGQDRVESLRLTAEDIREGVQAVTKAEVRDRLAARDNLESAANRINAGIEQTDRWLEIALASVQLAQQVMDVDRSLGDSTSTAPVKRLSEELTALREELAQAGGRLARMLPGSAEVGEQGDDGRLQETVRLATQVIATVTSIDTRLERLESELTELQRRVRELKGRLLRWIQMAAIGITVLFCWMAGGQVALAYVGWRGLERQPR
jgi:chromosome segregation ATPase